MSAESGGVRLELLGLTRGGLERTPGLARPAFLGQWGWAGVSAFLHLGARALRSGAWSEGHPSCDQLLGPTWDRRGQPDAKDPSPGGEERRGPRPRSAA